MIETRRTRWMWRNDVGIVGTDRGHRVADVMVARGARRHDTVIGAGEAVPDGDDPARHVRDHHRHKKWRQPVRPVLLKHLGLRLQRLDAALGTAMAEDTVIDEVLPKIKRRRTP